VHDEPFDQLMAMLDSPVFVVTTQADGQPSGCLVSFATQIGVRPPRFLVGIPKDHHNLGVASTFEYLAVHLLSQQGRGLAELFGDETVDQLERFRRCSWRVGPRGMPILDNAAAWFVARALNWSDVGDHVCNLLEPVAAWAPEYAEDLLYLSDFDSDVDSDVDDAEPDDDDEPDTRFPHREPTDKTRRYGVVRFTLDGL
jgi:flavin reductase (DIM6/NTAB) family NADH-FMN oxidoreductase RutF